MQHIVSGILGALVLILPLTVSAQDTPTRPLDPVAKSLQPDRMETYREVAGSTLKLHIFEPAEHQSSDQRSAFVIIHGGGWTGGYPWRCYPFADYFRRQGMVAISVEYRLLNKPPGTTVFDCVQDGQAAVRYVRQNAARLGINPDQIVVSGCSAGGHVAAETALYPDQPISEHPAKLQHSAISCRPNAMVLYYPVIDTSAEGYGQKKIGENWQQLSPVHQVRANLPPTIVFHGTGDTVTPWKGAERFQKKMKAAGNDCELVSHADGVHGYLIFDVELFSQAMEKTRQFLVTHKFITDSEGPRALRGIGQNSERFRIAD